VKFILGDQDINVVNKHGLKYKNLTLTSTPLSKKTVFKKGGHCFIDMHYYPGIYDAIANNTDDKNVNTYLCVGLAYPEESGDYSLA